MTSIRSCLIITVLSIWDVLSGERTGLSFVRVTVYSNTLVVSVYNIRVFTFYMLLKVRKENREYGRGDPLR
jgi:hypothetical protein